MFEDQGGSELRTESIVEVMRTAEGRTHNPGHMHVHNDSVGKRGSLIGSVDKGLKTAAFLEPSGHCSDHVACKD